ncbi:MAG: DNA helicase PcrA [Lachnospiraceae bacterium]|nr:DNA helicase PcrA [Lachnospiraceae bacterium]
MLLEGLNDKQLEAVKATEGPLLIIAGAGSGKTRVLTHRVNYLIEEKGVKPYNIMAITFTNKAAAEMHERIERLTGDDLGSVWVATFHSSCVRILRRHAEEIGFDRYFSIYDTDDQKQVMKEICKKLQIDTKLLKESMFLHAISSAKDELISPEEFEKTAGSDYASSRKAMVYREYQRTLKSNNAMDFDDLIVYTVKLFKEHPEVLDFYQERFKYIMVDEYQDTNTAQFELVRLLAGKYRNLCVVGDDDQSIYKFRGANIRNILDFEMVFKEAKVIKLEQNYRSTGNILKAANAIIKNNDSRKDKALWTDKSDGSDISFRQFETAYEEAEFIAADIASRVRKGESAFNDNAVLYRTNAQSRLLEEACIKSNVPYKIVGGVNFYSRKEVKDILAYLKTVANGSDDVAVRRIINVPKRGIGNTSIAKIQAFADNNGMSFYDALKTRELTGSLGKSASKISPFTNLIEKYRGLADEITVRDLIDNLIEEIGYREELKNENTPEALARIENLDEFVSKAESYCEMAEEPTLLGFLEEVSLVADIDDVDNDADYVLLMTLHGAKGLEFPTVYLAGMEDGLFPSYMSITAENPTVEIEEERRLCYVGITRAMTKLYITCARSRMVRGETMYSRVSRFISEIPAELLKGTLSSGRSLPGGSVDKAGTEAAGPGSTGGYATRKAAASQNPYAESAKRILREKNFTTTTTAEKAGSLSYSVGDRVRHMKFGEGTVLSIVDGGRDFEVKVDFDKFGEKKMFASFAKLKKM